MKTDINGKTYYGTAEICRTAGISRTTLLRWLKAGVIQKYYKNRRGWRLFTEEDMDKIRTEANKIRIEYLSAEKINIEKDN